MALFLYQNSIILIIKGSQSKREAMLYTQSYALTVVVYKQQLSTRSDSPAEQHTAMILTTSNLDQQYHNETPLEKNYSIHMYNT